MSLINVKDLYAHARANNYAVGYFESWNLESTYAVVRAAEKAKSPVMIGLCGEYIANKDRKYKEDLKIYGDLLKKIAIDASVPVVTLLNEAVSLETVYEGICAGFDMVMFVDEAMAMEDLIPIQKRIVEVAHPCNVAVEAELGNLPTANKKTGEMNLGHNTDPAEAAYFVRETGVDALAVAIGNVHLLEGRTAQLDMDLLKVLAERVDVPLILHGGTGIKKSDFKPAIDLGIVKVNIGAGLKRAVINAEKKYFLENKVDEMNPNDILGKGGITDIAMRGHDALVDEVIQFIKAFNGENQI